LPSATKSVPPLQWFLVFCCNDSEKGKHGKDNFNNHLPSATKSLPPLQWFLAFCCNHSEKGRDNSNNHLPSATKSFHLCNGSLSFVATILKKEKGKRKKEKGKRKKEKGKRKKEKGKRKKEKHGKDISNNHVPLLQPNVFHLCNGSLLFVATILKKENIEKIIPTTMFLFCNQILPPLQWFLAFCCNDSEKEKRKKENIEKIIPTTTSFCNQILPPLQWFVVFCCNDSEKEKKEKGNMEKRIPTTRFLFCNQIPSTASIQQSSSSERIVQRNKYKNTVPTFLIGLLSHAFCHRHPTYPLHQPRKQA
jgi:hypothetical protein